MPASRPEIPIAGRPAAQRPAASPLFIVPERTISTTSMACVRGLAVGPPRTPTRCRAPSAGARPAARRRAPAAPALAARFTSSARGPRSPGSSRAGPPTLYTTGASAALTAPPPVASRRRPPRWAGPSLVPTERHVEVLDRLPGRALHQIVEGREHHHPARSRGVHREQAVVGVLHVREPRGRAFLDAHEPGVAVERDERRGQGGGLAVGLQVEGREDAAIHRQQVRAEGEGHGLARGLVAAAAPSRRRAGGSGPGEYAEKLSWSSQKSRSSRSDRPRSARSALRVDHDVLRDSRGGPGAGARAAAAPRWRSSRGSR